MMADLTSDELRERWAGVQHQQSGPWPVAMIEAIIDGHILPPVGPVRNAVDIQRMYPGDAAALVRYQRAGWQVCFERRVDDGEMCWFEIDCAEWDDDE